MRLLLNYLLVFSSFLFFSCQSEEISSELETEVELEETPVSTDEETSDQSNNDTGNETEDNPGTETDFEEYFYSTVGGSEFNAYNPEFIEAYVEVNPETGVPSLFFFAYPDADAEQVFGFQLCFYDGVGEYYTGDGLTNSWCYFWDDLTVWYSDIKMEGDPATGTYTITNVTEEIIEGEFVLTAYNSDDHSALIEISGNFGVFFEDAPQY